MRTAVCMIVKDEAKEILYWLCWYKMLGFDSFIIYNDFSTDATEYIINSVSGYFDIRYSRNAPNYDLISVRQCRCYNDAIERFGDEFDWIALFDVDEYLDLDGKDIKTYLAGMTHADSIAFNWCCAGTNNFICRPEGLPVLNYVKHGPAHLRFNHITKVIFRPKKLTRPVYFVHNVRVSGETVDSSGQPIQWIDDEGRMTSNDPTWKGGRLYHYQSRSLEHYIRRQRGLDETRQAQDDPLHTVTKSSDYNTVSAKIPERYITSWRECMREAIGVQSLYVSRLLTSTSASGRLAVQSMLTPPSVRVFDPPYKPEPHHLAANWVSNISALALCPKYAVYKGKNYFTFYVENFFGQTMREMNGQLTCNSDGEPVIGVYIAGSNYIHLVSSRGHTLIISKDDPRHLSVMTFRAWALEIDYVAFAHPRTGRFVGSLSSGELYTNRLRPRDWEKFKIIYIEQKNAVSSVIKVAELLSRMDSLEALILQCTEHPGAAEEYLFNAITALPDAARDAVCVVTRGVLEEHLF